MAVNQKKTRTFKDKQCRNCELTNKAKLRKGRPYCPFPNPQIRNGLCLQREEK